MKRRTFINSALATAATAIPLGRLFAAAHQGSLIQSDINAVTLDGGERTIEKAVLQELAASLKGRVLLPSSEGWLLMAPMS